ncbi:MAG: hypothetical protein WAK33_16715 [Silvibacterium sp.]
MESTIQLALHVYCADLFAADSGNRVWTIGKRSAAQTWDQIREHAEADNSQQNAHRHFDPTIAFQVALLNAFQHDCL